MCTTSCPTPGMHATWGDCLRAKNLRIGWANSAGGKDYSAQKRWDSRLGEYRAARKQGIKPTSTKLPDIRHAVEESNRTGTAFIGTDTD